MIILEKKTIIKRKKKIIQGNIIAIHNIFFLNDRAKFSTNSILKENQQK